MEKYQVALSFAGEDRGYVEQVAEYLKSNKISVFYDKYEESELWGKDLYIHLSDIYKNKAEYTIMFISKYYNSKVWTNHERRAAQARAFEEKREYILPARFDDTEIEGLHNTIGYIDLTQYTPEMFAQQILNKLNSNSYLPQKNKSLSKFSTCPYCGTSVEHENIICLGCKAEISYGATKQEKENDFKLGLGMGILLSIILYIFLPKAINNIFNTNFEIIGNIHPLLLVMFTGITSLLIAAKFVKHTEKEYRQKPPRFFKNTMVN